MDAVDTASAAIVSPPPGVPVSDIDPFDYPFFDDAYPNQAILREAGPVVWLSRWGCYAVARYAEVHAILNDPATFCSGRGVGLADFAKEKPWRPPSLVLEADQPAHTRPRGVLGNVLSIGAMRAYKPHFTAVAEQVVDGLLARDGFDGIADLAEAFPMSVFPDAVGLCPHGREHLLPYASVAFNAFGPPNRITQDAIARSAPHVAYVTGQCQRDQLADGSLGANVHAAVDAGTVSDAEASMLVRSMLTAGIDTTVNGIGNALDLFVRFPDQWDRLRADPSLARNAFEEALRLESPFQLFFRTTTRAVEVGGTTIPADAKVLLIVAAANRDPRRWDEPERFDITRRVAGHVAFGAGIHMCVGQFVARLEGEVMLDALARKVGRIERIGPAERRYNNTLRGFERLPLRFRAAA